MYVTIRIASLVACCAFLGSGCSSEPNRPINTADIANTPATEPASTEPSTSNESAAQGTRLTAGQVAMITDLANTAEIEQGKLAESKGSSAKVKEFGAMMVKHHSKARADQAKLYQQLNITPSASPQANLLKGDADKVIGELRAADGTAFDVAYMNSQVDAHLKVLETIYNDLLPAATDEKLKDSLEEFKSTVESHLKEAKSIQDDLKKK